MKPEQRQRAGARPSVLRNVVMQNQPHALLRPAARVALLPPTKSDVVEAPQIAHFPSVPAAPHEPTLEERLTLSYDSGFAAGHAAAQQESQREVEAALREVRMRAMADGLRDGYEKGIDQAAAESKQALERALQEAQAQQASQLARMEALLAALPAQLEGRLAEAEDDMLALCHEVVCSVLGQAAANAEGLRAMLNQALGQMRGQTAVKAHLHPDDWALVQQAPGLSTLAGVEWIADLETELGGLVLRSAHGSLDARLDVQLANLRTALLAVRAEHHADRSRQAGLKA
jgi:flagellar assembly protein FliH